MNPTIHVDPTQAIAHLQHLSDQLPFATSKALNSVANAAQAAIRDNVRRQFTLRRPDFILNTIKIERADRSTKAKLDVTVRVDQSRDFLAKFEAGGLKTAKDGSHVTVPVDARRNKRDIIAAAQRPRALLASKRAQQGRVIKTARAIIQAVGRRSLGIVRVLYLLKTSVRIPARLGFVATATTTVRQHWVPTMTAAFADAVRTARRR